MIAVVMMVVMVVIMVRIVAMMTVSYSRLGIMLYV